MNGLLDDPIAARADTNEHFGQKRERVARMVDLPEHSRAIEPKPGGRIEDPQPVQPAQQQVGHTAERALPVRASVDFAAGDEARADDHIRFSIAKSGQQPRHLLRLVVEVGIESDNHIGVLRHRAEAKPPAARDQPGHAER